MSTLSRLRQSADLIEGHSPFRDYVYGGPEACGALLLGNPLYPADCYHLRHPQNRLKIKHIWVEATLTFSFSLMLRRLAPKSSVKHPANTSKHG
jgi:hypothetical protein